MLLSDRTPQYLPETPAVESHLSITCLLSKFSFNSSVVRFTSLVELQLKYQRLGMAINWALCSHLPLEQIYTTDLNFLWKKKMQEVQKRKTFSECAHAACALFIAPFLVCWYRCSDLKRDYEKKSGFEANWAVRNASICPLPYRPDSCKEDASGHLIMQIPKVQWPLQPEGLLPLITRLYTDRHAGLKKKRAEVTIP